MSLEYLEREREKAFVAPLNSIKQNSVQPIWIVYKDGRLDSEIYFASSK
jgi:hypothetical protein